MEHRAKAKGPDVCVSDAASDGEGRRTVVPSGPARFSERLRELCVCDLGMSRLPLVLVDLILDYAPDIADGRVAHAWSPKPIDGNEILGLAVDGRGCVLLVRRWARPTHAIDVREPSGMFIKFIPRLGVERDSNTMLSPRYIAARLERVYLASWEHVEARDETGAHLWTWRGTAGRVSLWGLDVDRHGWVYALDDHAGTNVRVFDPLGALQYVVRNTCCSQSVAVDERLDLHTPLSVQLGDEPWTHRWMFRGAGQPSWTDLLPLPHGWDEVEFQGVSSARLCVAVDRRWNFIYGCTRTRGAVRDEFFIVCYALDVRPARLVARWPVPSECSSMAVCPVSGALVCLCDPVDAYLGRSQRTVCIFS